MFFDDLWFGVLYQNKNINIVIYQKPVYNTINLYSCLYGVDCVGESIKQKIISQKSDHYEMSL